MSYIVQRQRRFYVVVYDGLDPLTGREVVVGIPSPTGPTPRSSPAACMRNELAPRLLEATR